MTPATRIKRLLQRACLRVPKFMMILRRALPCALAIGLLCPQGAQAAAVGTVIVARSGDNATLVWDASPVVAGLVQAKNVAAGGLNSLESQAVGILADRARTLPHSKTLTLQVMYAKSGAVSPAYGTATTESLERVFTLTAERAALLQNGVKWQSELSVGKKPAGVKVDVLGELPPQ